MSTPRLPCTCGTRFHRDNALDVSIDCLEALARLLKEEVISARRAGCSKARVLEDAAEFIKMWLPGIDARYRVEKVI